VSVQRRTWPWLVAAIRLCAADIQWQHNDVVLIPRPVLDTAASNLVALATAYRVANDVVDYGVVGSYACGVARICGDNPSDLDLAIYLVSNAAPLNARFIREDEHRVYTGWERRFQRDMQFPHPVNITFMDQHFLFPGDSNYVFYSLKTHTMRGRAGTRPRNVKVVLYSGTYAIVDRPRFNHELTTAIARVKGPVRALYRSNDLLMFGPPSTSNILFSLPVLTLDAARE